VVAAERSAISIVDISANASWSRGVRAVPGVSAEQGKRGLDMPIGAVSLVGAQCAPDAPHLSDSANRLMGVGIVEGVQ
jgi:hypothetical protein